VTFPYLARLAGLVLALCLPTVLAGCSSLGPGTPPDTASVASAQFGSGPIKVGLVDLSTPADLASGAPDMVLLAAQLAADTVAKAPITLLIRRYDGSADALAKVEQDLTAQGVKLVIGPDDEPASLSLARVFGAKGIPVISLANASDPKANLYAFGMSGEIEASLMADEMRRRGYRSVALVSDPSGPDAVFASRLATAMAAVKIQLASVDGRDPAAAAKSIAQLTMQGAYPSAIVFTQRATAAEAVMKLVRKTGPMASVAAVGTSEWAFEPDAASNSGPGWYMAPEDNGIGGLATQFAKSFKSPPTPDAALAYDLILLAAGLPQALPGQAPYAAGVLLNDQGFKGVTGKFWFTPDGQVHRNLVPIDVVPSLAQPAI
jgi:ABC-type branched-subunit amino acid transport system substrate-binding protein